MHAGIRIVEEDLFVLPAKEVCHSPADTSQTNDANSIPLQRSAQKLCVYFFDQELRENRTSNLQFHTGPGPCDHCKRRWCFFKENHTPRRLFDAAHCVTPQDLWRHADDADSAIIKHDDSFDLALGESFSSDLPKRVDIALEEAMEFSRLRDCTVDNSDSQISECSHHREIV